MKAKDIVKRCLCAVYALTVLSSSAVGAYADKDTDKEKQLTDICSIIARTSSISLNNKNNDEDTAEKVSADKNTKLYKEQLSDRIIYRYSRLLYVYNDDNTISVTSSDSDTTMIDLNGTIDGCNITSICEEAFTKSPKLKTVTLPDSLIYIGKRAFSNTSVESVTVPASVKGICSEAFTECKNLTDIYAYAYSDEQVIIEDNAFGSSESEKDKLTIHTYKDSPYDKYAKKNSIKVKYDDIFKAEKPAFANEEQSSQNTVIYYYRTKNLKAAPEGFAEDTSYTVDEEGGMHFNRNGAYISHEDYVLLCNCVGNEYGAEWVGEWEMALVCEVVYNRLNMWNLYSNIREVITAPNQFTDAFIYGQYTDFSSMVNDRVQYAVCLYLSCPEYFSEGYTSFRGDGRWNWFW